MRSLASVYILSMFCWLAPVVLTAQNTGTPARPQIKIDTSRAQSGWVRREIVDGDTIYHASIRIVRILGARQYKDAVERDRLYRYRRYAAKVYPYAMQAITLYDDLQEETAEMNRRDRKKYVRKQKKELKGDFEANLKKLYKTEGYILIKMIERQTGKSCYEIVKETRGSVTAAYWHNLGKVWGYDLKDGYHLGADPLLDEVLLDYDFGDAIYKY